MGLVDYASDSDDDSHHSPAPAPPPRATASSSSAAPSPATSQPSGLQLPPPKASNQPPVPAPRKAKGPVRILLDLPPPSSASTSTATDPDEPAKKRPKLALGGTSAGSGASGAPLTGLAAMLPKPKNDYKPAPSAAPLSSSSSAKPTASPSSSSTGVDGLFAGGEQAGTSSSGTRAGGPMFLPPSVAAKHKGKAPAAAPSKPVEPAVDFFGIGSVTSAPTPSSSSSSSSKPSLGISSAPSISSAPPPSSSQPAAPALAQPTAADPYPGFTMLPSGEWVAKDQATYDMWVAYSASQQQQAQAGTATPKDKSAREFDEGTIAEQGGLVDFDEAQRAREAWANRPSQVPGKEGEEKYKTSADIKGIPSQIGGMARRKHQLSSLLAAAHDNRAELEERIAQARANRKGAGSKYGF
ncbi:hypothetical protein JCM8208_003537 [Rhodotorula glutinis]